MYLAHGRFSAHEDGLLEPRQCKVRPRSWLILSVWPFVWGWKVEEQLTKAPNTWKKDKWLLSVTTSGGSGHFHPQRPLRCLFAPLSFCDWTTVTRPGRSSTVCHLTSATNLGCNCTNCSYPGSPTPPYYFAHFSVPAHVRFKTLILAYKAENGPKPT